jgi:ligand-binding sensor domain-containing protein
MDTHVFTGPHRVASRGIHRFDPSHWIWKPLMTGFIWDLHWDGESLWAGTASGVEKRNLAGELMARLTPENSGLLHEDVHATRRWGDDVWFAMLGDYQKETGDFIGGGVSRLNLATGEWQSFRPRDGLMRAYSCDLAVDDREVWVAHWDEETGLSRLDLATGTWIPVRQSSNGIEIGGVVLENDGETLWIGQQRGLVELDKKTLRAQLYTENEGLPGYIISGIAITDDAVWVSAYSNDIDGVRSSGIVRIRK